MIEIIYRNVTQTLSCTTFIQKKNNKNKKLTANIEKRIEFIFIETGVKTPKPIQVLIDSFTFKFDRFLDCK